MLVSRHELGGEWPGVLGHEPGANAASGRATPFLDVGLEVVFEVGDRGLYRAES
jgi:hypothetical protein